MALTLTALRLIAPHLHNAKVLCFGYPDLLVTTEEASKICGRDVRETSFEVAHKAFKGKGLADTRHVFDILGVKELDILDIEQHRGCEQVCDLNHPHWDYGDLDCDLVIDAGTIEHCANIGTALMSAADATKIGGRVLHMPPLSMCNHGFYNVCPTLLWDFYNQNGWKIEHLTGFDKYTLQSFPIVPTTRWVPPNEAAMVFMAQRQSSNFMEWPKQTRYMK